MADGIYRGLRPQGEVMTAQRIQIINRTTRIRDARFGAALPGLQTWVSRDFAPKWGADAVLSLVGRAQQPDPAAWKVWLLDRSDQPGDLGYHEDDTGLPESKIFVEDDVRYGAEITVTVSHELGEMLADPLTTRLSPTMPDGRRYAIEPCDPTEADEDGTIIEGIRVSNAVTPRYFGLENADGTDALDLYGRVTAPVPFVTAGGYLLWIDSSNAWHNTMQRYADGTLSIRAIRGGGRVARRAAKPPPA